jgi:hypothetical protein
MELEAHFAAGWPDAAGYADEAATRSAGRRAVSIVVRVALRRRWRSAIKPGTQAVRILEEDRGHRNTGMIDGLMAGGGGAA